MYPHNVGIRIHILDPARQFQLVELGNSFFVVLTFCAPGLQKRSQRLCFIHVYFIVTNVKGVQICMVFLFLDTLPMSNYFIINLCCIHSEIELYCFYLINDYIIKLFMPPYCIELFRLSSSFMYFITPVANCHMLICFCT